MRYRNFFALLALLVSLFAAPACQADGITIKGSDGKTELGLGQIDDIIRHVTGKTSGELSFEKESLLLVSEHDGALDSHVYRFDLDGSFSPAVETKNDDLKGFSPIGKRDYPQGLPIVVLPPDASAGANAETKALITPPYKSSDGQSAGRWLSINQHQDANNDVSFTAGCTGGQSLVECLNLNAMPLEVKNGVTVKGSGAALSAVLVRDGAAVTVYFVQLDASSSAVKAVSAKSGGLLSWQEAINKDVLPTMTDGTPLYPVSMAVGDFDNDGYKNEIALAWSDIDHVNVEVLQLSHDGAQFSVGQIDSWTDHDYKYDNIRLGRDMGKNLDGVTSSYSTSVVAGDFDGDGKEEFAVVFRDNAPSDSGIYYNEYNEFGDGQSIPIIFDGLTGKVHVVTHQWDGSRFLTSEKIKDYASFTLEPPLNYTIPLAVKAVAADLNGDGRDDIVPMIIRFDFDLVLGNDPYFDTFSLSGYVDWDVGASDSFGKIIFADVDADVDASGIGIGWNTDPFPGHHVDSNLNDPWNTPYYTFLRDPIRTVLTNGSAYPYMEREFDIAAGEFTGRIGEVITVDDLVIKRPDGYEDVWVLDPDIGGLNWNKLKSAVSLVYNLDDCGEWYDKFGSNEWWYYSEGLMPKRWGKTTPIASFPRDYTVSLVPGNYLGEGVKLGDPIKKVDTMDRDYIAILQAMPYHVDNVAVPTNASNLTSEDTSYLKSDPTNFTLRDGTSVTYTYSSGETTSNNLTYDMTTSAETIFAIDNPYLRDTSKSFQAIRGISTAVLGDSTKVSKGIEAAGKIWDKLKDTVTTTMKKSNSSATSYELDLDLKANLNDVLYGSQSTRYLWRYPVLTYPVPDWLLGQLKDTTMASVDKSHVTNQQTYITFAMSEPDMPALVDGIGANHYQPYHEEGNLFSYPTSIADTEGYDGRKDMSNEGEFKWSGPSVTQTIKFTSSTITQDKTTKVNKTGAITNFLSAVDNLAGTDLAQSPQDSDSSFTRNVTANESLTVKIPQAFHDMFSVVYSPYLDTAGTTTVAFAVDDFIKGIWTNDNSPYRKKPDPSLLLPEKWNFTATDDSGELKNGKFAANTDAVLKMRGLRFYLADYGDMPVDSPLVNGLKYKIRVPVYNASFVDADPFIVQLSYATSCAYNAERKPIGVYTFGDGTNPQLKGWKKGSNASRQFAEFEWTPDIADGTYYLFADIDPKNKLSEIHENRWDKDGKNLIDCGGNNMGYFCVTIATVGGVIDDGTQSSGASVAGGVMTAGSSGSAFPHIHWLKANGVDPDEFIEQEVLGADQPVSVEFQVGYGGDRFIPDALLLGYKLKAESKGKTVKEVTDRDIELYFLMEEFDLFPGENRKIHFRMDPRYLEDGPECIRFAVKVAGTEYPVTDGGSSSHGGGGCEVGFGALAMLAIILIFRKKQK